MMNPIFLLMKYNGTFAENANEAGQVTMIGMATIFVVLAALWGTIELLHFVMSRAGKRAGKKADREPVPVEKSPAAEEAVSAPDDGALIAAITAAIMAARAEEGVTTGFRVVSFRRANASRKRG